MAILEVEHLEKRFGGTPVLQDVSFSLEQGQTLAILDSSGSGKTTLLRCLNALEQPDAGCIRVAGETLFDSASFVVGARYTRFGIFESIGIS